MISGTSIFVVRWLAPLLFLTSIFLSVFSFVGPVPTLQSVSLIHVSPMNISQGEVISQRTFDDELEPALRRVPRSILASVLAAKVDGASVFVGPLGSCQKSNNGAQLECTSPSWFPNYIYSKLPSNAPKSALPNSPPSTSPVFYLLSLILSTLFFLLTSVASLADLLPKPPAFLTKLNTSGPVTRTLTSIGMLGFVVGMMTSMVWRISFGRDVDEFNMRIAEANGNPALFASLANGFTMMWVAFAFQAPLLVCQFFKLHVQAITSGKA